MVKLKGKKNVHEEKYKDHLIQVFADFTSDDVDRVRINTFCTFLGNDVDSPDPRDMPESSYTVVYKKSSIRKFVFFYVTNPKSFRERVVDEIVVEVNNFKEQIDNKLKDKEITDGLLDSLDKL